VAFRFLYLPRGSSVVDIGIQNIRILQSAHTTLCNLLNYIMCNVSLGRLKYLLVLYFWLITLSKLSFGIFDPCWYVVTASVFNNGLEGVKAQENIVFLFYSLELIIGILLSHIILDIGVFFIVQESFFVNISTT